MGTMAAQDQMGQADLANNPELDSNVRNNEAFGAYVFYKEVDFYLRNGHTFCTYMKIKNSGDISAFDRTEEIDCSSEPPNWKFGTRRVDTYVKVWEKCWRGLKNKLAHVRQRPAFTRAE